MKGYVCDGCGEFTKRPVKVLYPTKEKKLEYLGTAVKEKDIQDEDPEKEHYCESCGKKIHSIGEDDKDD